MNGIGYLRMADATPRVAPDADVSSSPAARLILDAGDVSIRPRGAIRPEGGATP